MSKEILFESAGERIYFDGVDEWTLPATYKRLVPLAQAMAIELQRVQKELTALRAAPDSPAQPVPDNDIVLDAARYRWLRQLDNAFDYLAVQRKWAKAHTPGQLDTTIDSVRDAAHDTSEVDK